MGAPIGDATDVDIDAASRQSDDNYDDLLWNDSGSVSLFKNSENMAEEEEEVTEHSTGIKKPIASPSAPSSSPDDSSGTDGHGDDRRRRHRTPDKGDYSLSRKASQVTENTAEMTEETAREAAAASARANSSTSAAANASTQSFSFEISLPPPTEVSPLGGNDSVIAAMMARSIDRALEMSPAPPFSADHVEQATASSRSSTDRSSKRRSDQEGDNTHTNNTDKNHRKSERHLSGGVHDQPTSRVRSRSVNPSRSGSLRASSHTTTSASSSKNIRKTSSHTTTSKGSTQSSGSSSGRDHNNDNTNDHRHTSSRRRHDRDDDEEEPISSTSRRRLRSKSEMPASRHRSRSRDATSSSSRDAESSPRKKRSKSKSRGESSSGHQHRSRSSSRTRPASSSQLGSTGGRGGMRSSSRSESSRHRHGQHSPHKSSLQITAIQEADNEEEDSDDERRTQQKSSRVLRSRSMSRPRGGSSGLSSSTHRRRSKSRPRVGHEDNDNEDPQNRENHRNRSRSRHRSPSRSGGERSSSKSRPETTRISSRSASVPPTSSSSNPGFIQPVMKSVKLRSSGPSFLSRLEESKGAILARTGSSTRDDYGVQHKDEKEMSFPRTFGLHKAGLGDDNDVTNAKSIQWNFNNKSPRTDSVSSRRIQRHLGAVSEEPSNYNSGYSQAAQRSTRDQRREERRRMRSKSRSQQENGALEGKSEDHRPRHRKTPKWSDLNNSISNLNLSRGSFDYDASFTCGVHDDVEAAAPAKSSVSVHPKIAPVAIKDSVMIDADTIANALARTGAVVVPSQRDRTNGGRTAVDDIISETKRRTTDSRMRQAKLESSDVQQESSHSAPAFPSHVDAMERLRRANALILEKKKRREDSKARQQQLENAESTKIFNREPDRCAGLTTMVSFHEKNDQETIAQFTPSLSEDCTAAGNMQETDGNAAESRPGRPSIGGLKALKKGMRYIGKSGRNLMAMPPGDDHDDSDDDKNHKAESTKEHDEAERRRSRTSRSNRDRNSDPKKSSKSKWKDLKNKLARETCLEEKEEIPPQKSVRWGSQRTKRMIDKDLDDDPDVSAQQLKKQSSMRWTTMKQGMSFINKMKQATEAGS